ncbi:MAG: bL21 family ribosomal protein, partial [Chlamydiia bacterium]|nr:bL21 family ribosomal protein [Chlamydiia bacterium]
MYAIIQTGGKQYRVEKGDVIEVELLGSESGPVEFNEVLI